MQQPWCNACAGHRCEAWDNLLQNYHLLSQGSSNAVSGGAAKLVEWVRQLYFERSERLC